MLTLAFKMSNNNQQIRSEIDDEVKATCELGKLIIDRLIETIIIEEDGSGMNHSLSDSINAWKQCNLSCEDATIVLSGVNSKLSEVSSKITTNSLIKNKINLYKDNTGTYGLDLGFKKVFWVQSADEAAIIEYKDQLFGSYKKISLILDQKTRDVVFCYEPYEKVAKLLLISNYIGLNPRECGRLLGYNKSAIDEWIIDDHKYCKDQQQLMKDHGEHYLKFLLESNLYKKLSMDRFKGCEWEQFTECNNCKDVGKDLVDSTYVDETINYNMVLARLNDAFSYLISIELEKDNDILTSLKEIISTLLLENLENQKELKELKVRLESLGISKFIQEQTLLPSFKCQ